jgi:hypothetical protein
MQLSILKILKGFSAFAAALFFSCDDGSSTLKQINQFNENPVGIAYNIRMTYTDSAVGKGHFNGSHKLRFHPLEF